MDKNLFDRLVESVGQMDELWFRAQKFDNQAKALDGRGLEGDPFLALFERTREKVVEAVENGEPGSFLDRIEVVVEGRPGDTRSRAQR